jgi:HEAT repeat protein
MALSRVQTVLLSLGIAGVSSFGALGADDPPPKAEITQADPEVIAKIRKLIRNTLKEDAGDREKAWKELKEMGNLAVPGLIGVYRGEGCTPEMTMSILIAMGDSKDPRVGPALVEILENKDDNVRITAARAIGDSKSKDPNVLKALKKRYEDAKEPEEVRLHAAVSAAKLGNLESLEALKKLIKAEKPLIRTRAVHALGKYGRQKQIKTIVEALKDTDPGVREDTVEALRLLANNKDAHSKAKEGQRHTEEDVIIVESLIAQLNDEDYKVRGVVMDALRDITGQKFGNEMKEWQTWWEQDNPKSDKKSEPKDSEKKDGKSE